MSFQIRLFTEDGKVFWCTLLTYDLDTLLEPVLTVPALSQPSCKSPPLRDVALFHATFHSKVTVYLSTQAVAILFRIMKHIWVESCFLGYNSDK